MNKKSNPKDVKKGSLILIVLLVLIVFIAALTCESKPEKALSKQEIRYKNINKLIYGNGLKSVNIKLMHLVKNDLNDPNSFGNPEITYVDKDSIIIITQRFTAKNALGGTVRGDVTVAIDTLGNITEVIQWID